MWEEILRHRVEVQLMEDLGKARKLYVERRCGPEEVAYALKRLNDFLVDGKWPEEYRRDPPNAT